VSSPDRSAAPAPFAPPSSGVRLAACLRLLRLRHWIKNAFIFLPAVFGGRLLHFDSVLTALTTFLSFSLVASSVYVLNDWVDRAEDRLHPLKRRRPIAAGLVPGRLALALGSSVLLAGLALGALGGRSVLLLEAAYLLLNLAYSFGLKHAVLLDVFAIAAGFVIRVWIGAAALQIAASHWLILCTFFLALFLGFGKRENELRLPSETFLGHRSVLRDYSFELISQLNLVVLSVTLLCYALYTVAPETLARFHTDRLVYSVPFVAYGLMRYLYLLRNKAEGGSPTDLLLHDRPLAACILLWFGYCTVILYFARA
jgi:decaprenyl-phosphate phosphoribosyltransferase